MSVKVGDVKDRVCVLLDDMSDSCGTLCKVIIIIIVIIFIIIIIIIIKNQKTIAMLIQMAVTIKRNILHRQPTC